jgi:hypothetical protein
MTHDKKTDPKMSENTLIFLIAAVYKIASMCVGLVFGSMGYKLFMSGIWGDAGRMDAEFGDTKLIVQKAAPGTFFALFGTIIVGFSVFTGINWHDKGESCNQTRAPAVQLPNKPPF